MTRFKNVQTLAGVLEELIIGDGKDEVIDAEGRLTLIPGLIDPHVHFRTPGNEQKEDWKTGARAAIHGGITTVFDMPNNTPPCVDEASIQAKKARIDQQLQEVGIPLRYNLYLGADAHHLDSIGRCKKDVAGIKIYMGSSTGGLLMDTKEHLERVFQIAAQKEMMVSVHAEDEGIIRANTLRLSNETSPATHSKIREREAAIKATGEALALAQKYNTQLLVHHVSTREELELIRQAKQQQITVYAEATPHHLFLSEEDYEKWGTKVQVNPPIRTVDDQEALWEAIDDGTIDLIGSDHAPHTLEEKALPYGKAPSGVPGIQMTLPLMLNAHHEGKITLERIITLMRINPENLFRLPHNRDCVLVDLNKEKEVTDAEQYSKCGWSPYTGRRLKGWPIYTILKNQIFHLEG